MRCLIVLPTYQEAANIVGVLQRVRATMPSAHLLVVDDSSPDGTADLAEATAAQLGGVDVTRRSAKLGLGSAYRTGFQWGLSQRFEILVEMDADLSHEPADVPRLCAAIEEGADLVIGSRYVPGGSIPVVVVPTGAFPVREPICRHHASPSRHRRDIRISRLPGFDAGRARP